jgi:hypothetical protein
MSSIRSSAKAVVALAGLVLVGCSTQQKTVYSPVNQAPIVGDAALALRADWSKSTSHYANGSVVAYSTRFPIDSNLPHPTAGNVLLEPTLFLVQVAILPAEFIVNPPWQEQEWSGEQLAPGYTVTPPLPPRGGNPTQQVIPYPFLGPQGTTPDTSLPGAANTAATGNGASQLPSAPGYNIAPAAGPTPPPFSPGGYGGPGIR